MIAATLFENNPYIDLPYHLIGWIGWFVLAALVFWGLRKNLVIEKRKGYWLTFGILLFASLVAAVGFVIYLTSFKSIPLPNVPRENASPIIQVLIGIPWLLAAGFLGVWPTVLIAFLSGILTAVWGTHNVFTPLEFAIVAMVLALVLRQNYRSRLFAFLRTPFGASVGVAVITTPLFLLSSFFSTNGSLAARLDFSFTQSWVNMFSNVVQLLVAGLVCEIFMVTKTKNWVQMKTFIPSPYETGLQDRVAYISLPLVLALLLTLAIADWIVAGKAAREMMQSRLESTARIAADNIPSVIDTGQGLILDIVAGKIPLEDTTLARDFLKLKLRSVPFFSQLFLFDLTGVPITGYPLDTKTPLQLSAEELAGIQLALNGVLVQNYLIAPETGETSAYVVYIAAIPDEYGLPKGVIVARSNLALSLFSQPAIQALDEITTDGGTGVILDLENRILYSTNPALVFTEYQGNVPEVSEFFDDTGTNGTRSLSYAAMTEKRDWKVVLSLPASYAQDLALKTAIPLLAISLLISLAAYFLVRFMVGSLTASLSSLALKADEISKGGLDNQIIVHGVDEVGRLGSAFEQMRLSLKKRLDELDTLLEVSQGIATNFGLEKIAQHLLNACVAHGADSARLVLLGETLAGVNQELLAFSAGSSGEVYKDMDKIILEQVKEEPIVVIPSKARIKRLVPEKGAPIPTALAGWSIRDGDILFGLLWIAYDQSHRFQDEEIRFLNTIAGQTAIAVSNAGLYLKAEVGKQRLESVLASTPESVLVVDDEDSLIIANHAARMVDGLVEGSKEGTPGESYILSNTLLEKVKSFEAGKKFKQELRLENGNTYELSISAVEVDNEMIGKVCVLRDVTELREMEKLKSDFIATISHDLRAPMGILRGYATMIQMVGDLTQQQKEYAEKISDGLEGLDQMVEKLLDIGRIESGVNLQPETVAPTDLFDHVIRLLQPQAAQRKVQVMRELTWAQEIQIEADKALLQQALYNLIENAIKFSPVNGQVFLRLQTLEDRVIFEVQDQGPGIAPLDIPKIFERGSGTGRNQDAGLRGGGLGLTIVKSIAERHGGRTWVKSVLGKGSTFFLEIPLRQDKTE